ncbi:hypothetical protein [Streptomyces glycanivorans]|uniref:Extensin n=1 Tax=Streptomyces glycanivorans TaxID=3033808 RepID=A0ABY9JA83_9ACTN|nr:hypothetical protein [Streptomyces sp. Alt3]WLQ64575.1 hypothetical protein P8A20_13660 [Streptomyces sp. Alt3]
MADEQHEWLDADAAESLLRGESVEPVDDHAVTEARKLRAALLALRTPAAPDDELPGEEAALAAFREASRNGKRAGAPAGPAGAHDLHAVRIGASPASPVRRRPRWTRPVRYGLAVSLAGCALGGVAVAGGTGMLAVPFIGHGSPVPATSVSAAASPEELGAEVPDSGEPSPVPSVPPRSSSPPAPSDLPDTGTHDGDGHTGQDGDGARDRADGGAQDDGAEDSQDGTDGRRTPERSPAEVYRKSLKACRAYREDTLSREEESRLLELADGETNLDRFCDRLLGVDDRDGDDGRSDDKGEDGGKDGDGGEGGGGSLPSITFRTPSAGNGQDDVPKDRDTSGPTSGSTASSSSTYSPVTR